MSNWRQEVDQFKAALKPAAPAISVSAIRFAFFGTVGGGKSVTAGIFAVGITPKGKYGWIDGEGHRSGWAIDQVASMAAKKYGGTKTDWIARFTVIHIDPPFNPLRVVAAVEILEDVGCNTIVLDIMSQAWDSDGGYLDLKAEELDKMAGDDAAKRNRSAASAAAHVKPFTHQKLVNKVNASKANLVLLFQAKQKWNAKSNKPDDFVTPIQESGLTRTAIAVGRVECQMVGGEPQGGFCTFKGALDQGVKFTHTSILAALPANGEQFKFEHAEAIARLCGAPGETPTPAPTAGGVRLKALKRELWELTKEKHLDDPARLQQWLVDEMLIAPDQTLSDCDEKQLDAIIVNAQKKLNK